jgi:hypothetical protein
MFPRFAWRAAKLFVVISSEVGEAAKAGLECYLGDCSCAFRKKVVGAQQAHVSDELARRLIRERPKFSVKLHPAHCSR